MYPFSIIGIFVVLMIVVFLVGGALTSKAKQYWLEWARSRGLQPIAQGGLGIFKSNFPTLQGNLNGHFARFRHEYRDYDENTRVEYILVEIECACDAAWEWQLYREHIFNRIGKAFGAQDIQTGYADFDQTFILKSSNEAAVRQLFSDLRLRQHILEQLHPNAYFYLKDQVLHYEEEIHSLHTAEKWTQWDRTVDLLLELVGRMEES